MFHLGSLLLAHYHYLRTTKCCAMLCMTVIRLWKGAVVCRVQHPLSVLGISNFSSQNDLKTKITCWF
jgi:hypothetical protein